MYEQRDPSNFRDMIHGIPGQFAEGFRIAEGIRFPEHQPLEALMISGMGGSALPGNIFRIYLADLARRKQIERPISIYQNRFYALPWEAGHALNIFASYSGNTEETLEAFDTAMEQSLPSVGLSSGGALEERCKAHGIPHVKLPVPFPNFQPRLGFGYFFGAMYQLLINEGLVPDTRAEILQEAEELERSLGQLEEQGKTLAATLAGKTPVIYASPRYKSIAMVWKININENAKTPAFWNFFPELNHNEMVGFTNPQGAFAIVMLRDPHDHPKNLKRYEVMATLLREKGITVEVLDMEGESVYTKVFSSILLSEFVSYYLAVAHYGIDPTPVDMVEEFKKLLVS